MREKIALYSKRSLHQFSVSLSRYGRLLSAKYADGISAPPRSVSGNELPSARLVSLVAFGEQDVPDPEYTLHNMQWGQIMTHDMSMQAGGTQSSMAYLAYRISCTHLVIP